MASEIFSNLEGNGVFNASEKNTFSVVLAHLARVADDVWKEADECTSILYEHKLEATYSNDIAALKSVRNDYKPAVNVFHALQSFTEVWNAKARRLKVKIEEVECHLNRSAMNWGRKHLPSEILSLILFYSADGLTETVTLSHVCKHFRHIVVGCRKMWSMFRLSSEWSPQQIRAVAERCGPEPLKADISSRSYYKSANPSDSAKAILDLHRQLGELCLYGTKVSHLNRIRRHLDFNHMPALQTLLIRREPRINSVGFTHSSSMFETPTLRVLDIDFVPHPTLARNLVQCTLELTQHCLVRAFLDFLSSASRLQELSVTISGSIRDEVSANWYDPVSIPTLVALRIHVMTTHAINFGYLVMEKLLSFSIRRLSFHGCQEQGALERFFSFVQAEHLLQELELRWGGSFDIGTLLELLPEHVECISLVELMMPVWTRAPTTFKADRLRILRFRFCFGLRMESVVSLRDFFLDAGHYRIQLEFQKCGFLKDGIFSLDSMESAFSLT